MKKWIKKPLMPMIVLIIICMSIFAAAHGELIVQRSEPMIEIMGKEVKLETYNINGNNYVKLRDFSEAMGMYVDWDGEKGKITISDTPLIDNDKYIIIDAGHGGYETGAKNDDLGLIEKDVNLNVAVKLAKMLESSGYRVKLTRSDDMTLVLEERMEQIVREKPDLYVSVHHNASEEGYEGALVLCQTDESCKAESTALAKYIGEEFEKTGQTYLGEVHREGDRGDYYGLLRAASSAGVTAVITEYAFIDNAADAARIDTDEELFKESEAIYHAICRYFSDAQ